MARLSRQTREIIKTVIAVLAVVLIIFYYVVYPLNKTASMWGSTDTTSATAANDPSPFLQSGLVADTFRVDADAVTKLACVYVKPQTVDSSQPKGTVLLVHGDRKDRNSLAALGKALLDSGYVVTAYDQRASGRTTGKYHGEGQIEAGDLEALVAYLDMRGKIVHPFIVAGYQTGGDAAIYASREESRINKVVAVEPYLTTAAVVAAREKVNPPLWFPFRSGTLWWWYRIRSGYAVSDLDIDSVRSAAVPTVLLMPPDRMQSEATKRFDQVSPDTLVTVEALASDSVSVEAQVVGAIMRR